MNKINIDEKEVLKRALRMVKFHCPSDFGMIDLDKCDCTCVDCWIDAVSSEDEMQQLDDIERDAERKTKDLL